MVVLLDGEPVVMRGFAGLFAAGTSTAFYERHGFAVHPGMTGMFRVVPEPAP